VLLIAYLPSNVDSGSMVAAGRNFDEILPAEGLAEGKAEALICLPAERFGAVAPSTFA
jgi:hypothetical protein